MTREAEARAVVTDYDHNAASLNAALDAYRDEILAAERERTAALVEALEQVRDTLPVGQSNPHRIMDWAQEAHGIARRALRAYEEGVSE